MDCAFVQTETFLIKKLQNFNELAYFINYLQTKFKKNLFFVLLNNVKTEYTSKYSRKLDLKCLVVNLKYLDTGENLSLII